ncbi:MAG TPA: hypothetical protein VEJ63_11910 [Planctomycetota bacterium]|nr:hypothetical protein [Planctomycetota bacterium]
MNTSFKVGDRVRRRHAWDGSEMAGLPIGPVLTITKVFEGAPFTVYQLLDGRTEFEFSLFREAFELQFETKDHANKIAS